MCEYSIIVIVIIIILANITHIKRAKGMPAQNH